MAQFFRTFENDAVSSTPSDFTFLNGATGTIVETGNGKALRVTLGAYAHVAIWDTPGTDANIEVYAKIIPQDPVRNGVGVRISDDAGSIDAYNGRDFTTLGTNQARIAKIINNSQSTLETGTSVAHDGTFKEHRLRANGNQITHKLWGSNQEEAAASVASTTDSDVASGAAGFAATSNSTFYLDVYAIGVGTGGDEAPTESVGEPDEISGQVTLNEQVVEGARVYLIDQSDHSVAATTTTDAAGNYTFAFVLPGTYDVFYRHVDAGPFTQAVLDVVID